MILNGSICYWLFILESIKLSYTLQNYKGYILFSLLNIATIEMIYINFFNTTLFLIEICQKLTVSYQDHLLFEWTHNSKTIYAIFRNCNKWYYQIFLWLN